MTAEALGWGRVMVFMFIFQIFYDLCWIQGPPRPDIARVGWKINSGWWGVMYSLLLPGNSKAVLILWYIDRVWLGQQRLSALALMNPGKDDFGVPRTLYPTL